MDKVLSYPAVVRDNIKNFAWQQCKNDTACFKKVYAERYAMNVEKDKISYSNRCFSQNLILACGSWEIAEAVPYLENELKREYCREFGGKEVVEMALAKLGNDSIKQHLIEKYTLRYAMKHSTLDTTNDNFPYYAGKDNWETINILNEGFKVAVYLKNKTILLNLLNLIYIKGRDNSNISESYTVSYFVNNFQHLFYKHPNDTILRKICNDYVLAIWDLDNKKLSKKEQKELDTLLSTAYRTKVKEQLQEWVIENVNFE